MSKRVKVYLDSGVGKKAFNKDFSFCEFIRFPYDIGNRSKKAKKEPLLAKPSGVEWANNDLCLRECDFSWEECAESEICMVICEIVGSQHKKDVLHLDSAYKSKVQIFLTCDNDIVSKRCQLEKICGFKIFNPVKEYSKLIDYINMTQ